MERNANPDFPYIFESLKEALIALAKKSLKEFAGEAADDTIAFLNHSKEKLERWTLLLQEGRITAEDFGWLLESQKDLVILEALKRTGISAIRLDEFKQKVLETIIGKTFALLGI